MTAEMSVTTQNRPDSTQQTRNNQKTMLKQRLSTMSGSLKSIWMRMFKRKVKLNDSLTEVLEVASETTESTSAQIQFLPSEILVEIFKNLDRKSLYNARSVNSRWNAVVLRNMAYSQQPITISRLTVSFLEESKEYKFIWCIYTIGENKCHELLVPFDGLDKVAYSLNFCFAQFEIQRLMIESMPKNAFNDKFVRFLCDQLSNCRDFEPVQLNIRNVDLSMLSSDGLMKLLSICAKRLEILEFFGIGNVASNLITDEHLAVLEPNRVRRLSIQFKDSPNETPVELQVGDESLQTFMRLQVFPTFSMEHCLVTAPAVCAYVKEWLLIADQDNCMKSHTITLTDCPFVSNESLEEELEQQGLNSIKRCDGNINKLPFDKTSNGILVNYTVRMHKPQQEFVINMLTTTH